MSNIKEIVRIAIVGLLILLIVGLLALSVAAIESDPQSLFTNNILSGGPTSNVTEMEQALLGQINTANSSIDAAIYDFNRASLRDGLIAAADRGVSVRVATDDEAYNNPSHNSYYIALETAGISVVNDSRSSIMHNKFFIFDGQTVWAGSTNITDNGFTYNHNNSIVLTSTLLADIYTIEFEEMYEQKAFGTAKSDNVTHTVDYNGIPIEIYFSPSDGAMAEVIEEVQAADESIYFSIFFLTDDDLRDTLIAKANEGVTVQGVWDLLGASNQYSDDEALCAAGTQIKIEDFGGKMHNKFMIIDAGGTSPTVITGSMNWTGAGGNANDENTLIIHDAATTQSYLTAYQELYDALGPETLCTAGVNLTEHVYLPVIIKPAASPPPPPPPPLSENVQITDIFYDGLVPITESDEYAEITNHGGQTTNLAGWRLNAGDPGQDFWFPSFDLAPGQSCRVYTNEIHSQYCGFSYGSGRALWNNGGDCGRLYNDSGTEVSTYCY